jgi:hypothetical protein
MKAGRHRPKNSSRSSKIGFSAAAKNDGGSFAVGPARLDVPPEAFKIR